MSLTAGILLASGLSLLHTIPFTAIFLITQLFGIRLYTITRREECLRVQKRTTFYSHMTNGKGYGYCIGYWYIMSIECTDTDEGDKYSIWMIATAASYEQLTIDIGPHKQVDDAKPTSQLDIYERLGSYYHPWYKKRPLTLTGMIPRTNQIKVIEGIKEHMDRVGHIVAFLYGPPGSGKSMIGVLLANSYGGSYCNTLRPWQPGDTLASIYAEIEPTIQKPLVIAFDEIDETILRIHSGIDLHKSLPIAVSDKTGWNQMLDEIQRGMYPNLSVLLTTNKTPEFIREIDPSYIREGRVDLIFEVLPNKIDI